MFNRLIVHCNLQYNNSSWNLIFTHIETSHDVNSVTSFRFIGEMALLYSYGPLGRNFVKIENMNINNLDNDVDLTCTAKAISDLLDVRDGLRLLPGLDRNYVEILIEDMCCY